MQTFSDNRVFYILSGLVCLEIIAQTYGFLWGYKVMASMLYFIAGLGVALLPLWKWPTLTLLSNTSIHRISLLLLTLLLACCVWRTSQLLPAAPIDYQKADMLPVIQEMARRWVSGEAIYAPIEEVWGGMKPIYLPAMWLPYSIAVLSTIDIRWVGIVLLLLGLLLAFYVAPTKKDRQQIGQLWALIPLALLCHYIFFRYSTLLTLSEEPLVVFYYLLLGFALFRKWPVLTGIAMALCLLSRYSIVFWVPMYLIYQFFYTSRKAAFTTLAALGLSSIVLLSIGQAWSELDFFLHLQDSYLEDLLQEAGRWKFIAQLDNNPGLVKFLPYDHITLWHQVLIWGSLVIPFISLFLFKHFRIHLNSSFFGLCSLKFALVYFYNMLTIPYSYLFYPSSFLSILILFAFLGNLSPKSRVG